MILDGYVKNKQPERDEIAAQIAEYERKHGKVETIDIIKRGDELKRSFSINAEGKK